MKRSIKICILLIITFVLYLDTVSANWYNNHGRSFNSASASPWTVCDTDGDSGDIPQIADNNSTTTLQPETGRFYVGASGTMRCLWWDPNDPVAALNSTGRSWTSSTISLQMQGSDSGGSGVNGGSRRWCSRIGNSGCTPNQTSTNFNITNEGANYITMYIEDNAGNNDTRRFGPFEYDNTSPSAPTLTTSSHSPTTTWFSNSNVQLSINMNNEGPSPATNSYCANTSAGCTPNINIGANENTTTNRPDGIWYIRALTRDTGGNSTISNLTVRVDTTDPTSQTANPISHPGGINWSNTNRNVTLNVSDANGGAIVSGIADAYYRWSETGQSACSGGTRFGGGTAATVSGTANTSGFTQDGSYRLTLCSIDNAGNTSEANFGDYNLDRNAPSAPTITVSNPLGNVANNAWTINNSLTVNVAESTGGAFNQQVGPSPHVTQYCASKTGGCTPNQDITGGGNIPAPGGRWQDGTRTIVARSTDTGGPSSDATYTVRIDTMLPVVEANPDGRPDWSSVTTLNIALTAYDEDQDGSQSGRATSSYVVNQNASHGFGASCGGTPFGGSTTHADFAEGTNYIHMCVTDIAGNIYTETFGLYLVDLTDPVIVDDYNDATEDGVRVNYGSTINFTATDAHSGIDDMFYCRGAGCSPSIRFGGGPLGTNSVTSSLSFSPDEDTIIRYMAVDWAGRSSAIEQIELKIEDNIPTVTSLISHHDGRDNGDAGSAARRAINFSLNDTGGSEFERVQVQVSRAVTNGIGGRSGFGGWVDAPGGNFTGLSGNTFNSNYVFPFENGNVVRFRVQYWDHAGNTGTSPAGVDNLWMDNVLPTVDDDLPAALDGVWTNVPVNVNFSWTDDHAGVRNSDFRFCTGVGCNPVTGGAVLPSSTRTFNPDQDTIFRYTATDRAGNTAANVGQIHVRTEDNRPTGTIIYYNGRDNSGKHGISVAQSNSQRTVTYTANDTGGSGLENVTLQMQETNTNNAGGIGAWPAGRTNVSGHENNNLNTNSLSRTYLHGFDNGRAVRFRLIVNDEATNDINLAGFIDSTSVIRMDNVDPTVDDDYDDTTEDGVRVNTARTINFTLLDNDSGIPNDITGRRYCVGTLGSNCTPNQILPPSLPFAPETELQLRYNTTDRAGNFSVPQFGSIDILIEDNLPTGTLAYEDKRDNNGRHGVTAAQSTTNRTVSYSAADTGGSLLEVVRLESRTAPTNSAGTVGAWGGWGPVGGTHNRTGLETATIPNTNFIQGFVNGTARQYRLYLLDEAGNERWVYHRGANSLFIGNATTIPANIDVLMMDSEDPQLTDDYAHDDVRINTTETFNFSITDIYSGVPNVFRDIAQNGAGRRFCIGVLNNTCTPNTLLPPSMTFGPDTERTIRYDATDRAGNDAYTAPAIGSINVLIEDNRPTGSLSYLDGWDNNGRHNSNTSQSITNRTITYSADDTATAIESNLRTVILQRGDCPVTGACSPTTWTDVRTHNIDAPTFTPATPYVEPFVDERSYMYRLYIEDWAGNVVAPAGYLTSTDILRLDDTDPTIDDNYTNDSIWVNSAQSFSFINIADNYSGIDERRYCTVNYGTAPCNPFPTGTSIPASNNLSYGPETHLSLYYSLLDNAENYTTDRGQGDTTKQIDILIEDDHATGQVAYQNIWTDGADASERLITYWARDDAPGLHTQSNIRTLRLEKRETTITADDGSIDPFPSAWTIINSPDNNHTYGGGTPYRSPVNDVRTLAATDATIGYSYTEDFANRTAHQYRVFVEDVAGNVKWIYFTTAGLQAVVDTEGLPAAPLATLKMEFHDADADFTNLDTNLSPNGWTNVTDQSVQVDFRDFGGSFLQSYTLQVSDVTDTFLFNSLGTPGTWANATDRFGTLHVDRPISGETDSITFDFIGENEHAYTFRVQITDIAGNVSDWIPSTAGPIKIDTIFPDAGDVSDLSEQSPILANTDQNFVYEVDRNNGAPISEVIGNFENATSVDADLTTNDNSTTDNDTGTGGLAHRININHSVFNVDNDRVDPQGHRQYRYRIIRIEDEAGNVTQQLAGDGIIRYNYNVYANTLVPEIGTRDLNGVTAITSGTAIADASIHTLTADLKDRHGNGIVKATGIGREVDFRIDISADSEIFLDQYTGSGSDGIFMETSDSGGFQEASLFETNPAFLSDLDFETGRLTDGEYDFNYSVYTPTASWYASTDPVSDPGARYFIANFQFAVDHTLASIDTNWNTGDQSLNQGQDIEFNFGPLFTTTIEGAIEEFGFIEGANQNSNIRINKANSAVNPNAENLWLEFGVDLPTPLVRQPSPLLSLTVFNPSGRGVGEGAENAMQYDGFNIALANGIHNFPIDSLLEMERGTTLDDIQESYISTHISYTLSGSNVMYNGDIMGKNNYHGTQIGGNTIQGGIKILGQTHSKKQKDIITDQEQDDIQLLGKIYKASLKKDIVKNAFTIIRNAQVTNSLGANPQVGDLTDFLDSSNDGDSLFNDSVMYFGVDSADPNATVEITGSRVIGKKTVLAYGRNIYINNDLFYDNRDTDILGIIALSDANGNGGNIYIDPDVTNIVGTLFAEKSLISYDGTNELGGGTSHNILRNQLHIYGSVFSENTIGGSRNDPVLCPYYVDASDCTNDNAGQVNAQKYDMNYLRRYFTYRNGLDIVTGNPYILPANNAKVIGGGTCDNFGVCCGDLLQCSSGNTNYMRNITNTNTDTYAVYPVVVEYNPRGQSDPAPLIEVEQ